MRPARYNVAFQYEIQVSERWWIVEYAAYVGFNGIKRARIAR